MNEQTNRQTNRVREDHLLGGTKIIRSPRVSAVTRKSILYDGGRARWRPVIDQQCASRGRRPAANPSLRLLYDDRRRRTTDHRRRRSSDAHNQSVCTDWAQLPSTRTRSSTTYKSSTAGLHYRSLLCATLAVTERERLSGGGGGEDKPQREKRVRQNCCRWRGGRER